MKNRVWPGRLATSLSSPWRARDTSCVLLVLSLIVFAKNFWLDKMPTSLSSLAQLRAGHRARLAHGERIQVYTSAAWY